MLREDQANEVHFLSDLTDVAQDIIMDFDGETNIITSTAEWCAFSSGTDTSTAVSLTETWAPLPSQQITSPNSLSSASSYTTPEDTQFFLDIGNPSRKRLSSSLDGDDGRSSVTFSDSGDYSRDSLSTTPAPSTASHVALGDNEDADIFTFEDLDSVSLAAAVEGDMTPLLKEELKYTILSKRHSKGQDEVMVEYKEPEPEQLTEVDLVRRSRRKESNRRAAQKCRRKKKEMSDHLLKETEKLESDRDSLKQTIKELMDERDLLADLFDAHKIACRKSGSESC